MGKFKMLAVTAAVIPYFCTDKCEIWLGKAVTNFIFRPRAYWCKNQSFDRRLNEIPACCHADTGQSFLPAHLREAGMHRTIAARLVILIEEVRPIFASD